MSKKLNTGQIIAQKKSSIRKLNNLLEGYIGSSDVDIQKKAYLISSWIQQFVSFVSFEEQFDPAKNISYKRGNIVKINFGFNVGCELGGPHYAIVLDKQNKHSADMVTVIPLVSAKESKEVYERDLFLGNELYNTLSSKYDSAMQDCNARIEELKKMNEMSKQLLIVLKQLPDEENLEQKILEIEQIQKDFRKNHDEVQKSLDRCKELKSEISLMKEGSIARIEQITSVSKIRIWIPKKTSDVLYNISFSENTMKRVNNKIKELYIFDE